jgi:hypothetical protein
MRQRSRSDALEAFLKLAAEKIPRSCEWDSKTGVGYSVGARHAVPLHARRNVSY